MMDDRAIPSSPAPRGRSLRVDSRSFDDLAAALAAQGDVIRRGAVVIFSHPDAIREIFTVHDRGLDAGPYTAWARRFIGNGLLCSSGELHRRQKSIMQPVLHPKRLARYSAMTVRHVSELRDRWSNGQVIDVHNVMMPLALRVMVQALFGLSIGVEADALARASNLVVLAFARRLQSGSRYGLYLPSRTNLKVLTANFSVRRSLRRFIDNRRKLNRAQTRTDDDVSNKSRDDLLDRLLAARDTTGPKPRPMGKRQLLAECINMFSAGHETTASAMTFTLMLLAFHPQQQTLVKDELDDVLGDRETPGPDDLDALVYTRMAVAESLRLFPPVHTQTRTVHAPCVIFGHAVAAGEELGMPQWVTHRDPRWWPDPLRYDPLRFTPEAIASRPRWAYFPFGGGQRACIGEAFAWSEIVLTMATILRRFWVEPAQDTTLRLEFGVSLRPATPIQLVLRS